MRGVLVMVRNGAGDACCGCVSVRFGANLVEYVYRIFICDLTSGRIAARAPEVAPVDLQAAAGCVHVLVNSRAESEVGVRGKAVVRQVD